MEESNNKSEKKIKKINILVAGKTGVGKSTLINAIFKKDFAQTGIGNPITEFIKKYEIENKSYSLFDTKGVVLQNYNEVVENIKNFLNEKNRNTNDESQHIHIAWVCISEGSSRIEELEIELVDMFSKYVPVIVVLTKSLFNQGFIEEVKKNCVNAKKIIPVNSIESKLEDGYVIKPKNLEKLINYTNEILGLPIENIEEDDKYNEYVEDLNENINDNINKNINENINENKETLNKKSKENTIQITDNSLLKSINTENLLKKINYYTISLTTALSLENNETEMKIKKFSNNLKVDIIITILKAFVNEPIKTNKDLVDKINKIFTLGKIQISTSNTNVSDENFENFKVLLKGIIQSVKYEDDHSDIELYDTSNTEIDNGETSNNKLSNKDESLSDIIFKNKYNSLSKFEIRNRNKSSSEIEIENKNDTLSKIGVKNKDESSLDSESILKEVSYFYIICNNILSKIYKTLLNNNSNNSKDLFKKNNLLNLIYDDFQNIEKEIDNTIFYDNNQNCNTSDEFNKKLKQGFYITDYYTVAALTILAFVKKESKSSEIIENIKNKMFQELKNLFSINDENILKTVNDIDINSKNDKDNINKNIKYLLDDIPLLKKYYKKTVMLNKDKYNIVGILNNTGIQICASRSEMFVNKYNL